MAPIAADANSLLQEPRSLPLAVLIRSPDVRQALRYGERQRPEHRSEGLLIDAQVADAPRTVTEITPLSRTCNRYLLSDNEYEALHFAYSGDLNRSRFLLGGRGLDHIPAN